MTQSQEIYVPLLHDPYIQGDSITRPFVLGQVSDLITNPYNQLNERNLPLFVANTDLSESRSDASNEGGKGVGTVSRSPHIQQISASRNISAASGKYKRFVPVAHAFAAMSKMPNTTVGCVILGEGFQVLSSGWSGAARGCRADVDERSTTRESRLTWGVHAEANAIANAARSGFSLLGSTLICTLMPCMTCAKLIVQAGIELVLCPVPTDDRWAAEFSLTRSLFAECDVDLIHYDQEPQ